MSHPVDVLSTAPGVIARISSEAALYGQEIGRCSGVDVASRLYWYNTAPLTAAVRRALPTSQALDERLGMSGPENLRSFMGKHWVQTARSWQLGRWSSWLSRDALGTADQDPLLYKLYISPRWEHLGTAIRRCLPVLAEIRAPAFKWGRDLAGILRPDKFIVYFRDHESLGLAAERLLAALGELPAQGVPFTAEVGRTGLLSWAKDPLPAHSAGRDEDRQSWRQRVCHCLAESLRAAGQVLVDGLEARDSALAGLRPYGIDSRSWTWCDPA